MGILQLFRRPNRLVETPDLIWLTRQAKYSGISQALIQELSSQDAPVAVLLVAHFPACLEALERIVDASGVDGRRVIAMLADSLNADSGPTPSLDEKHQLEIVVGERHPCNSQDEAIVDFARQLTCRCRIVHHVSLEDAVLRLFAGEWVRSMLEKLGMSEDEAIESRMVARRVTAALQDVENKSISNTPADSAEDWLRLNCPALWQQHAR